jgi:hypothetical protein
VAPGRPTPRASPPVPLVRITGHQCLRGRHCRLFLLRPHGRGHGAGRLACRCHARRRRGALFECCPIVRDVLSFSALTGARSGTASDALTMKQREEISGFVSKSRACRKECYSPKTKKPHFLFLESWGAPPLRPLAPPRCPPAPPPTTRWRTALCPPRGSIPQPPLGLWGSWRGFPPIRGCPLPSSSDDEFSCAGGGESPCCSCSQYSSFYCSRRSRRLIFLSFTRVAAPAPAPAAARR